MHYITVDLYPFFDLLTLLDSNTIFGRKFIAIGSDNVPIIIYNDVSSGKLTVVHCTSVDCSISDPPTVLDDANNGFITMVYMTNFQLSVVK